MWQLVLATTGFFLGGCGSTSSPSSALEDQLVTPSPFVVVGTVTMVDRDAATAVVRLFDGDTPLSQSLYSRTPQLQFTAQMTPTGLRTGRSVGVVIRRGSPTEGEEVVAELSP